MFDFPSGSLTVGQVVNGPNGIQYQWDGVKWTAAPLSSNFLPIPGGTLTGPITITPTAAGNSTINLNDAAGNSRQINFQTAGSERWQINAGSVAESGSNAGSNLNIVRYSDAGVLIATPLSISRATGVAAFNQIPTAPTPTAGDNSTNLATTAFVANAVGSGGGSGYLPLTGGTLTGDLIIRDQTPALRLNTIPGGVSPASQPQIFGQNNGVNRWAIVTVTNEAETGSNAGSNFAIWSCSDSGSYLSSCLNFNRASGIATFGGANVILIPPSGSWSELYLQKPASGTGSQLIGQTGTSRRWSMCLGDGTAESGSNAGSDFALFHYNDSGVNQGNVLQILRASGNANFSGNVAGGSYTSSGGNAGLYLNGRNGAGDQFCIYSTGDNNLHLWESSTGDFALLSGANGSSFTQPLLVHLGNGPGQFRMAPAADNSSYGSMFRNDGSNTYVLLTNQNDAYGTWNGLRPFTINNGNGQVTIGQSCIINGGLSINSGGMYSNGVISTGSYPGSGGANAVIGYFQSGGFWNVERFSQSATSNFAFIWYNNGNSSATMSSAPSDRRLKSNIKAAGDALSIVNSLPVYDLDFNRDVKSTDKNMQDSQTEHWSFSLIADEVGAILPHAALKQKEDDGTEHWTALDVMHLNSVLWRAVQQLTEKVAALEARA